MSPGSMVREIGHGDRWENEVESERGSLALSLLIFLKMKHRNGYMDVYQVMKAFVEAGCQSTVILHHTPKFARSPARDTEREYAIGCMRALMERAEAELNAD
jgi:hypothetical protein